MSRRADRAAPAPPREARESASGSYDPEVARDRGELVVLGARMLRQPFNPLLRSQITLVELRGVRGYVREHRLASSMEHFCMNSGARLGYRVNGDNIGQEALLVAAPRAARAAIISEVARLDALRRPVRSSPRWSLATAERLWALATPIATPTTPQRGTAARTRAIPRANGSRCRISNFGIALLHDRNYNRGMTKRNDSAPTSSQFAAFQRMFDYFNVALFDGKLPPVLLNFSRHANTLGFFAPERWEREGETTAHEISLNPAYLKGRSQAETASTLVHEMAHHWQQEFGAPSRGGYHNEEWAQKMESIGLMPSSTAAAGGKRVGYKVSHYIMEGGPFAVAFAKMPREYLLPWLCWEGTAARVKKPRQASKVKFTCEECGCNAWGKPNLKLVCGDCDEQMVAVGATDGDQACAA